MVYQPSSTIYINDRRISNADPVYFIAEIGSNFDQDLNRAKDLIYLAKEAGADAVKFQHYTAASLVSDHGFKQLVDKQSHQAAWKKSVFDTYQDASLNREWTALLKQTSDEAGIAFFTSPYSLELIDYVDKYVCAYKVGSGDITWIESIEYMASKGKPLLLATGASTLQDVRRAVDSALAIAPDLILMQCNTNYTAEKNNYPCQQLNVLRQYAAIYPDMILGLSDHMPGHVAVLGAVTLGARVIEKHFTDSTERDGPDHKFAMDPKAWSEMVEKTRELEASLGDGHKKIEANEKETVILQRRCIRANHDLQAGTVLSAKDLVVLRPCPADGVPPYELEKLLSNKLKRDLKVGEYIKLEDISFETPKETLKQNSNVAEELKLDGILI